MQNSATMTVIEPTRTENRFVHWTDWNGYQKFLELLADRRVRITYDRGKLELMSPSKVHEWLKKNLATLLEWLMVEAEIDYEPAGSLLCQREDLDKGFEPDECYWIQNCQAVRPYEEYDPLRDPPPDLAIEVEVSRSAIDRLGIYAAFKVPEIWRYTSQGALIVLVRTPAGTYETVPASPTFPWLDVARLTDFVKAARTLTKPQLIRRFRKWVREQMRKR